MLDLEDIIQNTSDRILDTSDKLVYGAFNDCDIEIDSAIMRAVDQALVELSMKVSVEIDRATDEAVDRVLSLVFKLHNMNEDELVEYILKNPDDYHYVMNPSYAVTNAHNFAKKL